MLEALVIIGGESFHPAGAAKSRRGRKRRGLYQIFHRSGSERTPNNYGIIGGRDQEDDESYRYRIHLKLSSQSGINEKSLFFIWLVGLVGLSKPGFRVSDEE